LGSTKKEVAQELVRERDDRPGHESTPAPGSQPEGADRRRQGADAERDMEDPVGDPVCLAVLDRDDTVGDAVDREPERQHGDQRDRHGSLLLFHPRRLVPTLLHARSLDQGATGRRAAQARASAA
jgi:hypothetical protein